MIDKPLLRSFFPPALTARLMLVAFFLLLIAFGYAFGIYDGLIHNNLNAALNSLIATLLYAVPALGLLRLKRWARLFELGLSILFVILGFVIMFGYNMTMGVLTIVPHGIIAIYLLSKDCRKAFGFIQDQA